jgi:hypothetical protein
VPDLESGCCRFESYHRYVNILLIIGLTVIVAITVGVVVWFLIKDEDDDQPPSSGGGISSIGTASVIATVASII